MIGICDESIVQKSCKYAMRNLADASDLEIMDMQKRVLDFMSSKVLGLPDNFSAGLILSSGSEANETGLFVNTKDFEASRRKIIVSSLSHSSVHRACDKLGLEVIELKVSSGSLKVSSEDLVECINKNKGLIAMVVLTHGVTKTGACFDIELSSDIDEILCENNIALHVDAAYGGFIFGLGYKSSDWTAYKSLSSVVLDSHKHIGVLGCAGLFVRNRELFEKLGPDAIYFNGNNTAMGTTRSAMPLHSVDSMITKYKIDGIRELMQSCRNSALEASNILAGQGWTILNAPESGVVSIRLKSKDEVSRHVRIYLNSGFKVSPVLIETNKNTVHGIRIAITPKPETNQQVITSFLGASKLIVNRS